MVALANWWKSPISPSIGELSTPYGWIISSFPKLVVGQYDIVILIGP
jgi:hypothetical protein